MERETTERWPPGQCPVHPDVVLVWGEDEYGVEHWVCIGCERD
jgi:hypothetical protein